jgi:hypothetical protein
VLALAPEADLPGMRDQFVCHFRFAEVAQPGKTSWNLEPWRPVVDDQTMTATGCNPGGLVEPLLWSGGPERSDSGMDPGGQERSDSGMESGGLRSPRWLTTRC